MFRNGLEYLAYQERYRDLLREADKVRLASQAQKGQKRGNRFSRVLIWLGRRQGVWGRSLEERYASESQPLRSGLQAACGEPKYISGGG